MGSLVLFSKPVPTIHGVFAPEVTVESFNLVAEHVCSIFSIQTGCY